MIGSMLTRKLIRDVHHHALQFVAVAAVVMSAVLVYGSLQTAYYSLLASRDRYFDQQRMADFFVNLEKAPDSALQDVETVPGVWRVRGRIVKEVSLDVEGNEGAVVGRMISMPSKRDGLICDIHLVSGSWFPGAHDREVIVNQRFVEANGLQVGDTFEATINERREDLLIVGTCYSPEYVYAIRSPQQFAPDDANFAVIFARESFVEDAFSMSNSFNDLVGLARPGADVEALLEDIEELLDPYGVYHKYKREDQLSTRYLAQELDGLRMSALAIPLIFLGVAAFVIHIVVRRMVDQQRTQIGLICALGYGKLTVLWHYTCYALLIGIAGCIPGVLGGYWLAAKLTVMYNIFFRFPTLRVIFLPEQAVLAFLLSTGMCAIGALWSAWHVLGIQPAVAIRPQAPGKQTAVHKSLADRVLQRLPVTWRMVVRNALRNKARSLLTVVGVSTSTAILLLGLGGEGMFDRIVEHQFHKVDRSDMRVDFVTERPRAALHDVANAPGVLVAEPVLQFGAELSNGHRKKNVLVMGLRANSRLYYVYDKDRRRIPLPTEGLLIPERLSDALELPNGGELMMDPYLKDQDDAPVYVRGQTEEYLGLTVYGRLDYLARIIGDGSAINGALVDAEPGRATEAIAALDDMPAVTAVTSAKTVLAGFQETITDLQSAFNTVLGLFAGVIAFAVIYNAASININEQRRDLACLHSLGYERNDVARVATADIMPLGIVGIALGLWLGWLAILGLSRAYQTDIYSLPAYVEPAAMFATTAWILAFQFVSRAIVARRAKQIDIIRALKSME